MSGSEKLSDENKTVNFCAENTHRLPPLRISPVILKGWMTRKRRFWIKMIPMPGNDILQAPPMFICYVIKETKPLCPSQAEIVITVRLFAWQIVRQVGVICDVIMKRHYWY